MPVKHKMSETSVIQKASISSRSRLKSNQGRNTESSLRMERPLMYPNIAGKRRRRKLVKLRKPNRWPLNYRLYRRRL